MSHAGWCRKSRNLWRIRRSGRFETVVHFARTGLQAFADQPPSFLAVLVGGGAKDNNYRNMMRRDLENKGEEYVRKTYPARAKYCIPILVDPADAPCRGW